MNKNTDTQSTDLQLELPKLGHQFQVTECASIKGWYRISLVPTQKFRSFILIFIQGLLLSAIVLAVLFGPDFLLDYSHRSDKFVTFFGKFFGLAVLFVTLCAFIVMVMRTASIYVNLSEKKIVNASKLTMQAAADSVSISEIETVQTEPPTGLLKRSKLKISIHDSEVILAECQGDNEDLIALRDWLNSVSSEENKDNSK